LHRLLALHVALQMQRSLEALQQQLEHYKAQWRELQQVSGHSRSVVARLLSDRSSSHALLCVSSAATRE
jgi:hypothetical protein